MKTTERYVIIGRICKEEKVIAYKVYDDIKKVVALVDRKHLKGVVRQAKRANKEVNIIGLTVSEDGTVTEVYSSFNVSKTDLLNGKGVPIGESCKHTLLGFSGFLEDTKYRLVDSLGTEKIVSQKEFEEMVEADKINGAKKSNIKEDKVIFYKHCCQREYNY